MIQEKQEVSFLFFLNVPKGTLSYLIQNRAVKIHKESKDAAFNVEFLRKIIKPCQITQGQIGGFENLDLPISFKFTRDVLKSSSTGVEIDE